LGITAIVSDSAGSLGSKPPGVPRSFLSFQRIDEAHPIIEGLFERSFGAKGRLSIESPRVYSAITMKAAPKGHTIISLADGRPFLADYAAGRGRVLMFAVDAGLSESDFPLKGLFAPLLHRSMMYLASEHAGQSGFLAGDQIACSVKLQQPEETRTYLLKSPSGVAVRVAPRFLSFNGMANFSSDASGEVGTYTLMSAGEGSPSAGQTPLGCIAVNVDTAESDLRAATPEALALFFSRLEIAPDRVKEIPLSSSLETVIRQTRFGVELWRYFLIAALVLAFLEMAVAREARHHSDDDQSTP